MHQIVTFDLRKKSFLESILEKLKKKICFDACGVQILQIQNLEVTRQTAISKRKSNAQTKNKIKNEKATVDHEMHAMERLLGCWETQRI